MDRYSSFEQLKTFEREGIDFRVRWRMGCSGIAILSIHGGDIEPGTSMIADAIAGNDHSYYALEGLKSSGNKALHITSTHFDEPTAIEIVCRSETVITVHGCSGTDEVVYVGGRDQNMKRRICRKLREAGFVAEKASKPRFVGMDLANICNLTERRMGVQLEISRGLRCRMISDSQAETPEKASELLDRLARAVREAIEPFRKPPEEWPTSEGYEK